MSVKVIANRRWDVFFRHGVNSYIIGSCWRCLVRHIFAIRCGSLNTW